MLQSFVRSLLLVATSTAICTAQPTISSLQPRTAAPGATTTWLLKGDKLTEGLRAYSSHADATFKVERVDDTTAHLQVTLPDDVPCGPAGLWLVTNDGISDPITWLVDDLHTIASDDHNHSTNSAQSLELPVAVDGQCDAAAEDVFRFSGTAGEWLSVDTFAQRLDANTDMVVRLTDSNGNTIQIADDDTVGPDSRFRTQLPASGEYFLFVRDSRYQGGGNYHLRLGDLPVASHLYPLAVMRGTSTQIETQGIGGTVIAGTSVSVSKTTLDEVVHVSARDDSSGTSHWGELLVRNEPQYKEEDVRSPDSGGAPKALRLPFGMSGRLNEAKQVDRYHIAGNQGVAIRVISRTRSLGLPTVLRMTLKDADGSVVAETAVNDSDEWSFDYTFPDDGVYALDVSDLLRRGGTGFDYWLAVTPIEPFAVSLKADAAVRERFLVEPQSGATPVDLQVQRNGYKGPITIDTQSSRHVRILNPVIPDGADAARIYLVADTGWSKDSLAMVRLTARGDT
ncbi:MAG: PPC domain-containing protein, partial [Planctomycetales bacterium]|nr:PPC domain-containing protein [Planctomycetales bacterium]